MLEILQENTEVITVLKPSGLPVFPLSRNLDEDTVLNRLLVCMPSLKEIDWPQGFEGGIVHRLDIPTSGLLLIAKNRSVLHAMREKFTKKEWEKEYLFLSAKTPSWIENRIFAPLGHDPKKRKRMIPKRGKNTKCRGKWYPAQTHFFHLERVDGISLWRARMRSGVMHQIRVHAGYAGIALLGDSLYGGGASPEFFPSRFALHHRKMNPWKSAPLPSWWPEWAKKYVKEYDA